MEYREKFNIRNFKFWAGAKEWFQDFAQRGMLDELQANIESAFDGVIPTAVEINDYVWFDETLHDLIKDEEDEDDDL